MGNKTCKRELTMFTRLKLPSKANRKLSHPIRCILFEKTPAEVKVNIAKEWGKKGEKKENEKVFF